MTTTSKLGVAPTTREFIFDPTAAADDGLIITGPSFVDAAAAHCGLPTSLSTASHPTSVDVSFNIKIDDEQPLPKPPEGKPIDVSEALTTDGDKPNAGDYNCIEDTYDTSKSMTSKALRSAHEVYGDGEMDHHLYTDVATMDKPCFQAIIGGVIKTFEQQIHHSENQLRLTAEGKPIGAWQVSSTSSETPRPVTRCIATMDMAAAVPPPELRRTILRAFTTKRSLQLHSSAIGFITSTLAQHGLLDQPLEWEEATDALAQGIVDGQLDVDPHSSRGSTRGGSQNVDNDQDTGPSDIATAAALEKVYSRLVVASSASDSDSSESDYNDIETPDAEAADQYQKVAKDFALCGFCLLSVVMSINGQWKLLDLLPMFDPPCSDTTATTAGAQSLGILVKMPTGDAVAIAKETCKMLWHRAHLIAMTGDNVNNAPPPEKDDKQYIAAKGASNAILKLQNPAASLQTNPGFFSDLTLRKTIQSVSSGGLVDIYHHRHHSLSYTTRRMSAAPPGRVQLALDLNPALHSSVVPGTSLLINPEQQEQDAVEEHLGSSAHASQEEEPMYVTIDHVSEPLISVFVLLATTTIGSEQVRQGIVGEDGIKPYEVLALFISLIKKLVKWQLTHDDNPPTSKDRDAFLKLQNVYRTRTLQDFAQFKQLVGETCKSAGVEGKITDDKIEVPVKHAGYLKPIRGCSKKRCPSTQVFTVSSHHLGHIQPALNSNLALYGTVVPGISSLE
ncbi:hypothetical protein NDA13_006082 [Ustilago tritici]|nr:hypothetical protein NDA13_006082 [Ustilago tritici]